MSDGWDGASTHPHITRVTRALEIGGVAAKRCINPHKDNKAQWILYYFVIYHPCHVFVVMTCECSKGYRYT